MPAYEFVTDILRPYLDETRSRKKPRTIETDRGCGAILEEYFRGMWLGTIQGSQLNRRTVKGAIRDMQKDLSDVRIKRVIAVGSRACNWAIMEWSYDITNPFQRQIEARSPKRTRYLSDAEEKRLLLACEGWLRDIVIFALNTGLRVSEIIDLTWDRIHGDEIHFQAADQKSNREGRRALNDAAMAVVARRRCGTAETVFANPDGTKLQRRHLHSEWRDAVDRAGLPDLRFHDLRRSCGQRLLEAGCSMEAVQAQLGHEDVRTTQSSYVSPSINLAKEAVKKLRGVNSDGVENLALSS